MSRILMTGYVLVAAIAFVGIAGAGAQAQEEGSAKGASSVEGGVAVADGARESGAVKSPLWKGQREAERAKASKGSKKGGGGASRRESYIRYTIVGGGSDEPGQVLTVRGDGTMKFKADDGPSKEGRLNASALKELIDQFSKFEHLESVYGEKSADPFQPTITLVRKLGKAAPKAEGNARTKAEARTKALLADARNPAETITIYPSAELTLPSELTELLDRLDRLIASRLTEIPELKTEFHGIAAAGMIDRYRYPVFMTEEPEAPEMWFHLSVSNLSNEPFELRFFTAQSFDVTITRDTGEEVYRWSAGQAFAARTRTVRLVRDFVSFVERIPLKTAEGKPFEPGRYTLQYQVMSDPPFSGQTAFEVEQVPVAREKEDFKAILERHRAAMKAAELEKAAKAASGTGSSKGKGGAAKSGGGKSGGAKSGGGGGGKKKKKKQ